MGLVYFVGLALLIFVGYVFGRARAVATGQTESLHSRPSYHGAFVALSVLVPMMLVFVIGMPIANHVTEIQALHAYDPQVASDELKRGAVLRDIVSLATGRYSGEPPEALLRAADTYASFRS
jgi:phosphate transport system permease protein